jgi:hypothetical protein
MSEVRLTGGCQCGAVRYALLKQPERPSICHCRMCQKSSGNLFATWAGVEPEFIVFTRGQWAAFASSDEAERTFCSNCGTPMGWQNPDRSWICITLGTLDHPELVPPVRFYGEEGRISWTADVAGTHGTVSGAGGDWPLERIKATNHQHPDHDTTRWTPHPASRP